ncbi:MAG: hypothetical protein ACOY4R_05540 [Pseudomonadota bacterium]
MQLVSILVVACALAACVAASAELVRRPVARWRLVAAPALALPPTLVLLNAPPPELLDPQVWMLALVFILAGVVRGALIGIRVDHARGRLLMSRAREAFWVMLGVAALVVGEVVAEPFGKLTSPFAQTVELFLVVLTSYLVGRNAALLVRSRDAPHHDL